MTEVKSKLLKGVKPILQRFELSEEQFYMFVGLGLPCRKINGRWYGHEDNIDRFLQKVTVGSPTTVSSKEIKKRMDG